MEKTVPEGDFDKKISKNGLSTKGFLKIMGGGGILALLLGEKYLTFRVKNKLKRVIIHDFPQKPGNLRELFRSNHIGHL